LTQRRIDVGAADRFEGYVDAISATGDDCFEIIGWAHDLAEPLAPVDVEVVSADRILAKLTANRFREDLRAAGYGYGQHGFHSVIPTEGLDLGSLSVVIAATGVPLSRASETKIASAPAEAAKQDVGTMPNDEHGSDVTRYAENRQFGDYFDCDYYQKKLAASGWKIAGKEEALPEHYKILGWKRGLNPTPYFDVGFYLATNGDVRISGMDPFEHFINYGCWEFRDPHPAFDCRWYYNTYLVGEKTPEEALYHYLTEGWRSGNSPNPLFWSKWYAKMFMGPLTGLIDPFYHFLTEGHKQQRNPNPLFDIKYYVQTYGVKDETFRDPLSHYIRIGSRNEFNTHPLFDAKHIRSQLGMPLKRTLLEYILTTRDLVSPHPLFDPDFVQEQIEKSRNISADGNILVKFLTDPACSRMDPHPLFSKSHYHRHAPDVSDAGVDAFLHFLSRGWQEKRAVHPLFDARAYSGLNSKKGEINPLLDYVTDGFERGCVIRQPEPPDETIRPLADFRKVVTVPDDKIVYEPSDPDMLARAKIGVFAHVYYPELIFELIRAANNVPCNCTVYISTDGLMKARAIEIACRAESKHPFEIRCFPNRGRDIAPMLVGFRDKLQEVDYGVHIHSKMSLQYKEEFTAWRQHLVRGNLGTEALVRNILGLLSRDTIGAYMPDHFTPIKSLIQWGGNFTNVRMLLEQFGEELTKEHFLDFPSGSMFWFKTKALAPLLESNLRFYHFEPESGQIDGTLAHAIERSFFYFIELAGFEWIAGKRVSGDDPATSAAVGGAPASNRIFPLNRELGELRRYHAECTKFVARGSSSTRPRINLLIPTVDTSVGYAGVTTALDVFHAVREALGRDYDARLIATDTSPGSQYDPPGDFELITASEGDSDRPHVVIDAARRSRYPFFVRDDDIFMATAWWTAQNAFDLMQQQDRMFGRRDRSLVYLIQDYECGFSSWSTRYALAETTYRRPRDTIPIFNTDILFEFFKSNGYYDNGHVLSPGIHSAINDAIVRGTPKEKIVLLYARPHAERNCLSFLDALIETALRLAPDFWADWRFIAVGENFDRSKLRACERIEILGRLGLKPYAALASRAALGISLMISPHPSYPPLEMAAAGVQVITNTYGVRDLAKVHDNIHSFEEFDLEAVARKLRVVAEAWIAKPDMGWTGKPKIDWFFEGRSNLAQLAASVAQEIRLRSSA
jgi:hypothetical protein